MILTSEKEKIVIQMRASELDSFRNNFRYIQYEDYNHFIEDFLQEFEQLFINCSKEQYDKIKIEYDPYDNIFDV